MINHRAKKPDPRPSMNSSNSTNPPSHTSGHGHTNNSEVPEALKSHEAITQHSSPKATGGVGVKQYDAQDIRDTLQASQRPSLPQVDSGLLARSQEIAGLPPEAICELMAASNVDLGLSALPLLPGRWQRLTSEVKALMKLGLPHPSNLALTCWESQAWFQGLLFQLPTWFTYSPLHPGVEPTPILIQSRIPPCPGDLLCLASLHRIATDRLEMVTKGEDPNQHVPLESELQMTVMWSVIRVLPGDVDALALGAISDRGYFRVLPGSRLALSPEP